MKGIATLFVGTGAIFAVIGMVWGIQMSATQDHSLSPAHGHLNLIGFVIMTLYGLYYAVTPAARTGLAKMHYLLTLVAVVVLVPGIVMALTQSGEVLAKLGSVLTLLSMLTFVYTVFRKGVGSA